MSSPTTSHATRKDVNAVEHHLQPDACTTPATQLWTRLSAALRQKILKLVIEATLEEHLPATEICDTALLRYYEIERGDLLLPGVSDKVDVLSPLVADNCTCLVTDWVKIYPKLYQQAELLGSFVAFGGSVDLSASLSIVLTQLFKDANQQKAMLKGTETRLKEADSSINAMLAHVNCKMLLNMSIVILMKLNWVTSLREKLIVLPKGDTHDSDRIRLMRTIILRIAKARAKSLSNAPSCPTM